MKKIFIYIALMLPVVANAQLDRSVRPEPGQAPNINIKDSEVFTTANGVTVILSENHKLPRVSFNLYTGSDPMLEGNKAGLSEIAGNLILSGTTNRTKDQLDNEKDYIGASLNASASSISMSCLTKHMDKGLELMSDVLLNANFPSSEFDRIVKQNESGLMAAKSDPGTMANNAQSKVNFPGHPYGEVMTEATLKNITRDDVVKYYKNTFGPKGSYLVIVGDINRAEATAAVEKYFNSWTGKDPYAATLGAGTYGKGNRVIFVKKPGAVQSTLYISFPMKIKTGDEDQIPVNVLNGILGGSGFGARLMQNLREDKAYTYGCRSSLNITENGSYVSMGGNFRNEVTDSAITQILFELDRITKELVTDEEIALTKSSMAGSFARSLESPSTIARFAYNIIKYNLTKDYYQNYLKRLEGVTKEDVLAMAKKYFTATNCNIIVVGNEEIVDKLKVFDADGKIEFLDAFGDPVKDMEAADITAEQLFEKYVLATTQSASMAEVNKKMKKIKSYKEVMDIASPQIPIPLSSTSVWIAPNTEASKMEGQGMVLQKSFFDGTAGSTSNMQTGKKDMTAEEIAAKKKAPGMLPEMNYSTSGMEYELQGIQEDGGKRVYVVRLNDGESETYEYYDATSFMKVKTLSIKERDGETSETTITYSDYKAVNGILFPHIKNLSVGEMTLTGTVTSMEVNAKIKVDDYK